MKSQQVSPVHLPPIVWHTLGNGLRIAIAQRQALPLVTIELLMGAGSFHDPVGKEGLASFTASLLARGTQALAPEEVSLSIEQVGGRLDAGADRDRSVVTASALAEDLELALGLVADVALRPLFDPRELETMKRRMVAELEQSKDDPSLLAARSLLGAFLPKIHPYASPVGGSIRTVSSLDRRDVQAFHLSHYVPERGTLIVVGDVEPARVIDLAERHFLSWEGGGEKAQPAATLAPPTGQRRIRVIHKDEASQVQVRMAGPAPLRRTDPLFFPATVANAAFGGGFTSRLVNEIRVNRGLSYSVGTGFALLQHAGFFTFSSFTRNETVGELLRTTLDEAERARDHGFTEEEVLRSQRYLAGLYPLGLETNEQVAGAIAEMTLHGLPDDWVSTHRGNVMSVTREEAHLAAKRFFFGEPHALVLVGDASAIHQGLEEAGVSGEVETLPLDEAV